MVVLCNGIGASTLAWKWIVKLPGYRFLVWHYRGSTPEPAPLDLRLQRHAQDAIELIEHLELDVHALMGWSMGVGVATWIAATLPHNPLLIFKRLPSKATTKDPRVSRGMASSCACCCTKRSLARSCKSELLERLCERSVDLREQELLLLRPLCG